MIVHVVNDVGAWGAGFSGALGGHYLWAEQSYRAWTGRALGLSSWTWSPREIMLGVGHLCAQRGLPSRANPHPLDLDALDKCLAYTSILPTTHSIHMPRIGCGLAGGTWVEVEPLIRKHLDRHAVFVYDLEQP